MTRWSAVETTAEIPETWDSSNPRAGLIAGCWITAIWIAACCAAIVLLGACSTTSQNAEAEDVVIAPASAASATTPADPAPSPSLGAGQPPIATAEPDTAEPPVAQPLVAEPAAEPVEPVAVESADIRAVDFRNGFTYSAHWGGSTTPVTVSDGGFQNGEIGDDEYFSFYASTPVYGDLTGDGVEEAAVVTSLNGGGSGFFDSVQVFAVVGDEGSGYDVVQVGDQGFGDRAFGGVWNVAITDQRLVVDAFTNGFGSCCPHTVARELYWLDDSTDAGTSSQLAVAASHAPLRWVSTAHFETEELIEVDFLPGTSAAVLELAANLTDRALTFEANAGQFVTLKQLDGPAPLALSLTALSAGESPGGADATEQVDLAIDDLGAGSTLVLPASGLWRIDASFPENDAAESAYGERAGLLLSITDVPLADGGLDTKMRRVVVQQDPLIVAAVSWPDVRSRTADAGALSELVRARVNQPIDEWIAYAVESLPLPRPDGGGDYQSNHRVTLVTDDLVSVHFGEYEYLCCRPYPNLRQRSLVIDVTNGRILDDAEIVDLDRLAEVEAVWLAAIAASDEWDLDPDEFFGGRDEPGWSALTLSPGGLTFGTDRSGALHPISTFVSFEELGDLVTPDIARQVATGTVPHGF